MRIRIDINKTQTRIAIKMFNENKNWIFKKQNWPTLDRLTKKNPINTIIN